MRRQGSTAGLTDKGWRAEELEVLCGVRGRHAPRGSEFEILEAEPG